MLLVIQGLLFGKQRTVLTGIPVSPQKSITVEHAPSTQASFFQLMPHAGVHQVPSALSGGAGRTERKKRFSTSAVRVMYLHI